MTTSSSLLEIAALAPIEFREEMQSRELEQFRNRFQKPTNVVGFSGAVENGAPRKMKIEFQEITKTFAGRSGAVLALDHINVTIEEGEFVCLVGPSGCGKSTLLNMLAGFEHPTTGKVLLDGTPISGPSIERAMMFQESALFPWLSARGNVEFGLKSLKLPKEERAQIAQK